MRIHYASIFSWQKFQDDIRFFVEYVDEMNYMPLRERACSAIRKMRQEWTRNDQGDMGDKNVIQKRMLTQGEWPLSEHGHGGLPKESDIMSVISPTSYDLGDWFLVILAEYLRSCLSPLGNWSVLNEALTYTGWNKQDREQLFLGFPTYKLLKPNLEVKSAWPITNESPYWLWLHPHHSRAGWLPNEKVHQFHVRLQEMERNIQIFDVRQIPNIDTDNPIVIEDYKRYLEAAYQDTITMLSSAEKLKLGLFMSVWFG